MHVPLRDLVSLITKLIQLTQAYVLYRPYLLSRYLCGSLRVPMVPHGERRAAVTVGGRSVTLWVGCGSHEGFERKSPLYVLELYPHRLQLALSWWS